MEWLERFSRKARHLSIARALRSRNYRLFFSGQGVSLIGTWMTRIATGWLVYKMSHSAILLGVVGFASQIPAFFITPFAGVLIDRWNLHKVIIITQILAMVQSLLLAVLVLTQTIEIWHIVVLSAFQGLVNAFDMPARQSFMIQIIEDKKDLTNAIALNSSIVNGTRLIGPTLAGVIIAIAGEGICFLLDSISYLAVIWALFAMKIKTEAKKPPGKNIFLDLKEGIRYAFGFAPIRSVLLLLSLVSFMGMPYTVLMPVYTDQVLHRGPHTLGFLMGAAGCGALLGALYLAWRKSIIGIGRIIPESTAIFGMGLIAFAFSRDLWLSLAAISLAGFGMMVQMASSNMLLQTIVDDDKRGRIMSFYVMAFAGMSPFGSLFAGALGARLGITTTLAISGAICVIGAFIFLKELPRLRKLIRPIYLRKGIIQAVQTASELSSSSGD